LIVAGAFDFTNRTPTGVIEDHINPSKGFFGFGERTFDFIEFRDVKFGNEELVGGVLGSKIFKRLEVSQSRDNFVALCESGFRCL
jgi:hypothetical protein